HPRVGGGPCRMGARQPRAPRRGRHRGAGDGVSVSAKPLFALVVAACGTQAGPPTPSRATFASLRYVAAPPPADVSNRYGDDPAAAQLGHKLYFDKRMSGQLLDPDNGALAGSLGPKGTPGLVACASCHVPKDGFVDTRSPGQQISLAAQWTARK